MGAAVPVENPKDKALDQMAELAKYTAALAAGALVFSADLITKEVRLTACSKVFLVLAWAALTVSIAAGVLTFSRFPMMIAEQNRNLEDRYLIVPGRIQQILLILGIACLGTAMILTLLARPTST